MTKATGLKLKGKPAELREEHLILLDACISHLNDIVIVTDACLDDSGPKIILVNEAFERQTGYSAAEAVGKTPRILQGEKTDRRVLEEIRQAMAAFQPIRRQLINYRKNGEEYWLDIDLVPIFDKKGKCTHFFAIERDVTQNRLHEDQLLWKTAFFEAKVNSSLDAVLIVDNDGKKILQNQKMSDMWGIPEEMARDVDDHQQFEWVANQIKNPKAFTEKVAYLYAHPGEISRDEIELKNGVVLDRYSAPVLGKDGKHFGRIWSFRDISEQKHSAERIAEQADLLDKARDAIMVRDLEGKILFWNKGAERIYGWTPQEVIGRNVSELLYSQPGKFQEMNGIVVRKGEWQGELQHVTKELLELTIEARWTLIRDNQGRPKSILAINTDVTERKKIEVQFMRSQRMESIGTLAGGIAHDLNNILAPILLSIELLKKNKDHPRAQNFLNTIEASAKRGSDIVRQVLSFAKGVEGERIEVQPRHLLHDLESIIRDTFPKNIHLHFSIAENVWPILGDPTQIHQILLNLCVNARDAMPRGGTLGIQIESSILDEHYAAMNIQARAGRYVKITVTDTGSGIPPDLLEKIFEPFFTTKEIHEGTGLGLSTVMAIVKSHEGTVEVSSSNGNGTTFKIYLPAAEGSVEAEKAALEERTFPRGNGETILVVDDELSILVITGETLEEYGYKVLTARDGAEAVAVYAENRNEIDVVLTDMMMPVMDGPAAIQALVRISPNVRIIATSGLNAQNAIAKVTATGVRHFLNKPYTAEVLLQTVQASLQEG